MNTPRTEQQAAGTGGFEDTLALIAQLRKASAAALAAKLESTDPAEHSAAVDELNDRREWYRDSLD